MTRILIHRSGYLLLLALFAALPFHAAVSERFVYYREAAAAGFFIMWLMLVGGRSRDVLTMGISREMIVFIAFPCWLILMAAFDPGIDLYGDGRTSTILEGAAVGPTVYVLRNALLYVPLVLYLAVRGLSVKEVRLLSLLIVLAAPFAVLDFLQRGEVVADNQLWNSVGTIAASGGAGLAYNTFVPYLTFPALAAIYLVFSDRRLTVRFACLAILTGLSIYILFSTSRQSLLFIAISALLFIVGTGTRGLPIRVATLAGVCVVGALLLNVVAQEFYVSDKVIERFGSAGGLVETPRWTIAKTGLALLDPLDFLTGAGIGSVVFSGPHNDYIRWIQRVGIIIAALGFYPYFRAALRSFKRPSGYDRTPLAVFVTMAVGFTLFHSIFGYPRDDAYQAPYAYLGIGLWFALQEGYQWIAFKPSLAAGAPGSECPSRGKDEIE